MRTNWNSVNKAAKSIKRLYKDTIKKGELLNPFPEKGYMNDYKKVVVGTDPETGKDLKERQVVSIPIVELTSPALRRLIKTLDSAFYISSSETEKDRILNKKKELETELNSRPDNE